ncbi:hypothetical protein [Candidatus Poriferisodalis sp.]|uniref:hypothetical protein n=1 Tax=Candidatus Poriferisodalis sp. TaxID=3101277 RepID=UPI003B5C89BC
MSARPGNDQAAKALTVLHESCRQRDERSLWPELQVRDALTAGASLEQVAAALGIDEDEAWERLTRCLREALSETATANADLAEIEALELAVAETNAVRRERSQRKVPPQRRSGLSL